MVGSDPKLSEDHKQELNRKQKAGGMINSFIKPNRRFSFPKKNRDRTSEVVGPKDGGSDARGGNFYSNDQLDMP